MAHHPEAAAERRHEVHGRAELERRCEGALLLHRVERERSLRVRNSLGPLATIVMRVRHRVAAGDFEHRYPAGHGHGQHLISRDERAIELTADEEIRPEPPHGGYSFRAGSAAGRGRTPARMRPPRSVMPTRARSSAWGRS